MKKVKSSKSKRTFVQKSAVDKSSLLQSAEHAFALAKSNELPITELLNITHHLTDAKYSDLAIQLYQIWLECTDSPLAYAAQFNLGVLLDNAQDNIGAEVAYRAVIKLNPDFAQGQQYLNNLLVRTKQFEVVSAASPLEVHAKRARLEHFDALSTGIIFALWLGPYVMSHERNIALQSIFRDSGRPVCFITDATLHEWERPDFPFHSAYRYLSEVHRADYLRCYLMHHYGGGYTDIKPVLKSWTEHFNELKESNCLALGYPEISASAVAQLPGELGEQLRKHYAELIGYCSMIFHRRTELTAEWLNDTHRKLDDLLPDLQAHPAQHPMDQLGVTLPSGIVSKYPLPWTALGGNIFHPVILKYKDRVVKSAGIIPQLYNYR